MGGDLGRLKATPWLFFAALTVVQNVFVGPWTVLPAYLPIVLGAAVLQPALRDAAHLGADDEPGDAPEDDPTDTDAAPSSELAPDVEPLPAADPHPEAAAPAQ